jgi:hypothetical protein
MTYNPNPLVPNQVADQTLVEGYNPRTAQAPEGQTAIAGNPTSDCYGLRLEPFNECGNFRSITNIDELLTGFYNLIVTNVSGENISKDFVAGITRSIYSQVLPLENAVRKFTNSVFAQVPGSNSYWLSPSGEAYYPSSPEYSDPNIDRTRWSFYLVTTVTNNDGRTFPLINKQDFIIYGSIISAVNKINQASSEYIPFDITGESYACDCRELNGFPFELEGSRTTEQLALGALRYLLTGGILGILARGMITGGVSTALEIYAHTTIPNGIWTDWPETVAKYGPDAVTRGEIGEGSNRYEPIARFFNMCLDAKECIKDYKNFYPQEYATDVQNLTEDQINALEMVQDFQNTTLLKETQVLLASANQDINIALAYATDEDYYIKGGQLNSEVLYKTAIVISVVKNLILILTESLNAVTVSKHVYEEQQTKIQQEQEYNEKLADEARERRLKEEILGERLDPSLCRIPEQPNPNPCLDPQVLNASKTKTFLSNWTAKDKNSPFHSMDQKKYYLVYDVVLQNVSELTEEAIISYKEEAYKIFDNVFKLNLNELSDALIMQESINRVIITEPDGIFYEPRAFKPSKLLFSMTEETAKNFARGIDYNVPRFTDPGPTAPYIKTYTYTIQEFFDSLEGFENVLKKYVFDHAMWKLTFGNENPAVTNLQVSASPIFNKIKLDILKQDSKNFQKFKPLFSTLLSKNGIMLVDNIGIQRPGQYLMSDKITLVFQFEQTESGPPPVIEGTNVVSPVAVRDANSTPTNNAGAGLLDGVISGKNVKLYRAQIMNSSRPPTDLLWKSSSGEGGNLSGLNSQDVFKQDTAMNYLMNLNTLLTLLRPDKNDWK